MMRVIDDMDETDWMFDALYELSEAADLAGMKRLNQLLDICMDVYSEEERLLHEASMMFRSCRAVSASHARKVWPFRILQSEGVAIKPAPPDWLDMLEARIAAAGGVDPEIETGRG